ncbi:MAG TPA: sigma-70 family RNA polymerase sigma factor [Baekduia sp.]|uniref:sigma-70 family RNA polymerase sigma factor n=1 Tax=Baekduia sp. TaxID=2600305 RepID=UPI002D783C44|nr:sigma-70 family RNA polymerase sigma factor [Baekduia sp.]HET6506974.1 sigma-70 family RNA polymerase sigma factor [Baekduia sp.]
MSAHPTMRPLDRMSDTELVAALRAGDPDAFAALCARHEPPLRRYARHILRARPAIVDDVVQESLLRAHHALRRDDRHIEVRPYLYRLVRNCCLDELARVRTDSVPLHLLQPGEEPATGGADDTAHDRLERRDRLGATLADLAALPESQRHALVRREIDGLTHEQVAAELGITAGASKSLVYRAREALTRAEAARDARCEDVRFALLRAHDDKRRAPMGALRHAATCADCRAFRTGLKSGRRALGVLVPLPLLLGGGVLGGAVLGASKPVAVKTAALGTAAVLAAGGAYALDAHVFRTGDPAPIALTGVALPGGHLAKGAPLPPRTALVTRRVRLPAASATLSCPAGMRVAGLVPVPGGTGSHGFDATTVVGASTTARIVFAAGGRARTAEVAIFCRVPDARGSVRAAAGGVGRTRGRLVVHACRRRATLSATRGGRAAGTVTAGEPLAVLAGTRGWLRVRTDAGARGWIRAGVAC